jgi:hypothetical protein
VYSLYFSYDFMPRSGQSDAKVHKAPELIFFPCVFHLLSTDKRLKNRCAVETEYFNFIDINIALRNSKQHIKYRAFHNALRDYKHL